MFDAFARQTAQGIEAWTVEDGGRIRHRDPATGTWAFQTTPSQVRDTLHRVFFLSNSQTGWAVGQNGWVLKTTNGGSTWSVQTRVDLGNATAPNYEELYDVHFLNAQEGWLVGKKSLWFTDNGGANWATLPVWDPIHSLEFSFGHEVEAYAIDVVERANGARLGLITLQPGIVIRSYIPDPTTSDLNYHWQVVWDIHSLCPNCGTSGSVLQGCECDLCLDPNNIWFEPWDVEIGSDTQNKLAVLVGGTGSVCGSVFASTDDGATWHKEWHECTCTVTGCQSCQNLPAYNDDSSDPFDLNRHQWFRTLYGVGLFEDNSGVAVGYNGQFVIRNPTTGVWNDRSVFSVAVPTTPGAVVFPMIGADALTISSTSSFAIATGEGGYLRESVDGGNTWTDKAVGEPNRIKDVCFVDDIHGWHVGQFSRICKTSDGGVSWTEQSPQSKASAGSLQAITFASAGLRGVTVGDKYIPQGSLTTQPRIRYTDDGATAPWKEDVTITGDPSFIDGKGLNEVDWAGNTHFWAVGDGGLILNSRDGGQKWSLYVPTSPTNFDEFTLHGVSFLDTTTGIIVGSGPDPATGAEVGAVFQYQNIGGSLTFTPLALPSGVSISELRDVDIGNGAAWAVGDKLVGGVRQGVVVTSVLSGGVFGSFVEITNPPTEFPICTAGEDLGAPVLSEVEVAPNTGDIWVGGMCGRVWVRSVAGVWTEVKSQTDAHISGMSFVGVGSSAAGYLAGMRQSQTQQCIVRVQ